MAISKKSSRNFHMLPSGTVKKQGLSTWRFVFTGVENVTGQERKFFIEFSFVNPGSGSDEAVLGYKSRVNITADDLQNVLAGSVSAQKIKSESFVVPTYAVVRAGCLGAGAKQVCAYFPAKNVRISQKPFKVEAPDFIFTDEQISGRVDCSPGDVQEHPEFLCEPGIFTWSLRYEVRKDFEEGYSGKDKCWYSTGTRTVFAGNITVDGKEYNIVPKKSSGYIDRYWGKNVVFPWIHLSSSNLTSIISGKTLSESCFAVQGIFDDRVSALVELEEKSVVFNAGKGKHSFEAIWDFSQMPGNEGEEKLHWTVSLHNKSYVVDIDVFCSASQMYVRSLELPEGNRRVLKDLCGGTGTGEIRLYKRIHKNLELIEHAHIAGALCEYGQEEVPEE